MDLVISVFQVQKSLVQLSFSPGGGKLSLQSWMAHLLLPEVNTWGEMEEDKQTAHTLLFHKGPKVRPARDVPLSSKDGSVTMFEKSKLARKPTSGRKPRDPVLKVDKTPRERSVRKKKKDDLDLTDHIDVDFLQGNYSVEQDGDIESEAEGAQTPTTRKRDKKKSSPIKRDKKRRKVNNGGASGDIESEAKSKSEGKTKRKPKEQLSVRRKLTLPSQSDQGSQLNVNEERTLRKREVKPKEVFNISSAEEFSGDSLDKEMKAEMAATRQKERREKFFGDSDDDFQTPKTSQRERKKPKHFEAFYCSDQVKGKKGNKKGKGKKTLADMFSGRRRVDSSTDEDFF